MEYIATVVVYGALNYLKALNGEGSYSGRDIVHDQGILDRIGGVVGVSLTDPTRRFVAGGSFELLYGVNLLWVADFLRTPAPIGVAVGQPFSGTQADIKTQDSWHLRGSFGLALDLVYFKELVSGRISP